MTLTDEERARFAAYLEEDARSSDMLVEQMDKLANMGGAMQSVVKRLKVEAAAARMVAEKLRTLEGQTISGG